MIQQLVEKWVEYTKGRSKPSVRGFSQWLYHHEQGAASDQKQTDKEPEQRSKQMLIGILFGRLVNFVELWAKLAFKDLPIRHFEDYAILREVREEQNPSKNALANVLVNEKSTVFEIIKRLTREKLLVEKIDRDDRRIRRVSLTEQGKTVLKQADRQANKVAQLLTGHADEATLDFMLDKFAELNDFHTDLYQNKSYDSIDDLL